MNMRSESASVWTDLVKDTDVSQDSQKAPSSVSTLLTSHFYWGLRTNTEATIHLFCNFYHLEISLSLEKHLADLFLSKNFHQKNI